MLFAFRLYRAADTASGGLICFMVAFSPWAFGTTQPWSIWTMNVCGYTLGLLLAAKLFIRGRRGYRPSRWDDLPPVHSSTQLGGASVPASPPPSTLRPRLSSRSWTLALAILTALILGYCLISALNARATYDWSQGSLIYRDCLPWLPHSYDAPSTWRAFWNYLALAAFFWALRDWLLDRTATEARNLSRRGETKAELGTRLPSPVPSPFGGASVPASRFHSTSTFLPSRLRWLLWLLSLNGALLAVEGIAQRLSGTNKLLWLMPTRLNREAFSQFGPYAYRSNGAQYLNLMWPATLGFWWTLRRDARRRRETSAGSATWRHHVLLPCILAMAAAPIISTSRGGAIIAVAMIFGAGIILMFAMRRRHPLARFFAVLSFCSVFAVGAYLGGDQLIDRMGELDINFAGREASYDMARGMATDHPVFGLGPGTFEPMFQFYRNSDADYWPVQLHNDWLETRITFGWAGSALIALVFLLNSTRALVPGGISVRWPFTMLIWLALGGCLLHARWDFPLQIYSILSLFLLLCAILSTVSLRKATSNRQS